MTVTKKKYQEIKDSPALSYITQMHTENDRNEYDEYDVSRDFIEHDAQLQIDQDAHKTFADHEQGKTEEHEANLISEAAEKKDYADTVNKTETFEDMLQSAAKIEIPITPAGYRITPQYRELKTHRTQLVFPPSLFRKTKKRAKQLNVSFNEFVCLILQAIVGSDIDPKTVG